MNIDNILRYISLMVITYFSHLFQASTVISPWAPGYNVVGEKLKRNTTTNQVSERSITTASASNLGDVKVKDIDGIINRGKKVGLVGIIIFWMKKCIMNLLSEVLNNRLMRKRGIVSTQKMEYQVFVCIFPKNSTLAT